MGQPTARPADPLERARLLARIRDAVLSGAPAPAAPRTVVSDSWRRSLAARVDPEHGGPPRVYDPKEIVERRAEHPLAEVLPLLRETLVAVADEAMHMMLVTDEHGHILWREGQRDVLHRADAVGLVEGTRWSEDAIGTNAMGTALAEDIAVQIHSAEHLVRAYHAWTCAACPVHDPDTGRIIGVVDVTGPVRGFHPATMALVQAAAKLAENHLRTRMLQRDETLRARCAPRLAALHDECGALVAPSGRVLASRPDNWLPVARITVPDGRPGDSSLVLPDGRAAWLEPLAEGYLLRIRRRASNQAPDRTAHPATARRRPTAARSATPRGGSVRAAVTGSTGSGAPPIIPAGPAQLRLRFLGHGPTAVLDGRPVRLTQRHADMLTMLALAPDGVSAEQLATGIYGDRGNPVTARAEIHRLRAQFGAEVVGSGPYRLCAEVSADFLTVREELAAGRVRAAITAYRGELRPGSEAPMVIEERELLAATVRRAVLDAQDPEAMWLLVESGGAADDLELAERLAAALSRSDPRHATMAARAELLRR